MVDQSLQDLDDEFKEAGVPLRLRPLECFKRLHGPVQDKARRKDLFDPITLWYIAKYGDSAIWDGVVGRFPLVIKGELYLGVARFVEEGEVLVDFRGEIEGLPEAVAGSLSVEEFRPIAERMANANSRFRSLYNLEIDEDFLGTAERDLVKRARADLAGSVVVLKHNGDTQKSIFESHEAAEKFFKAALLKSGYSRDVGKFGHDIPKLFRELARIAPRFSWLSKPVDNLQSLFAPNMGLRYRQIPVSVKRAVEAFYGSLFVCGTIAQIWLFEKARGTSRSAFRPCRFYVDGQMHAHYCHQVRGNSALLTFFHSSNALGSAMVDKWMDMGQSAMYLEITDPRQEAQLRAQLVAHYRNPGRRVTPEEVGLKSESGVEGSFTTAMIKRRLEDVPGPRK